MSLIKSKYVGFLQADTAGGYISDEMRMNNALMGGLLDMAREVGITKYVAKFRTVPRLLFQTTYLLKKAENQEDDCFTTFRFPGSFIQLNSTKSGIGYVGPENRATGGYPVLSPDDYANQMQSNFGRSYIEKNVIAVYYPDTNLLKINKVGLILPRVLVMDGVFSIPTAVPEYNEAVDSYPITQEIYSLAKDYLLQTDIKQILSTLPNKVSNSIDDASIATK